MAASNEQCPWSMARVLFVAVVSALIAALWLAMSGSASAQNAFQANATATAIRGSTPTPCSNGAYICGTANIAGYGAAAWNLFVTSVGPDYSACGSTYTATTDMTLSNDPASTLVLDEVGNLCGLGHDGAAYKAYFVQGPQAWGHPFAFAGTWTVDPSSTGQFAGLVGSGTDTINVAGAHIRGNYTGVLGT